MIYLLDTNILTELIKANAGIVARFDAVPERDDVATSIISRIEMLEGRFSSIVKAANKSELLIAAARLQHDEQELAEIEVLPISEAVAEKFEWILSNKKLKKIGREDLLIACIALAHDATLVTRNTKDFTGIPGLKVENWAN